MKCPKNCSGSQPHTVFLEICVILCTNTLALCMCTAYRISQTRNTCKSTNIYTEILAHVTFLKFSIFLGPNSLLFIFVSNFKLHFQLEESKRPDALLLRHIMKVFVWSVRTKLFLQMTSNVTYLLWIQGQTWGNDKRNLHARRPVNCSAWRCHQQSA